MTICIFRSTPQNIGAYAGAILGTDSFALSDKKGSAYTSFHVKKASAKQLWKGTVEFSKTYKQYKKYMTVSAAMTGDTSGPQLPADFLIDENGIVVDLLRAESMSDHMPFERIEAFIPKQKRCKCNKKDCIVPKCRENYELIRKEAEAMLFMG